VAGLITRYGESRYFSTCSVAAGPDAEVVVGEVSLGAGSFYDLVRIKPDEGGDPGEFVHQEEGDVAPGSIMFR